MENHKVKEIIEMCEKRGLTAGRAKQENAILEIMWKAGVTAEEVDEAWTEIRERREEADKKKNNLRKREERREEAETA